MGKYVNRKGECQEWGMKGGKEEHAYEEGRVKVNEVEKRRLRGVKEEW